MVNSPDEPVRNRGSSSSPTPAAVADDPVVLRAQIERTRAEMGRTIDEIQTRLSPEYIKQQTQETIREATVEKVENMAHTAGNKMNNWRSSAMQTVKENPIPAAMIGIGIGWLLFTDTNGRDEEIRRGYYESTPYTSYPEMETGASYRRQPYRESGPMTATQARAAETAEGAREWAHEKSEQARQKAQAVQHQAAEKVESARESMAETGEHLRQSAGQVVTQAEQSAAHMQRQARRQARRAKRSFWETLDENPLAVGVAAMAAGALVGLALPSTRVEDEWMGETRDHLAEEVTATTQETLDKTRAVAKQTARTAVEEAKREAEKQELPVPSTGKSTSEEEKERGNVTTTTRSTPSTSTTP